MMKDPKKAACELAARVGKHEAQRLLMSEGVSSSLAQKLVGNRYQAENIGQLVRQAILRALEAAKLQAS